MSRPSELETFLRRMAGQMLKPEDADPDYVSIRFAVSENPDAIKGDAWLHSNTSFIWRVGVLAVIDGNKCDFAWAFIAHERKPGKIQFIGMLHWKEGENDDMGRSLDRAGALLADLHPAFDRCVKEDC